MMIHISLMSAMMKKFHATVLTEPQLGMIHEHLFAGRHAPNINKTINNTIANLKETVKANRIDDIEELEEYFKKQEEEIMEGLRDHLK